MQIPSQTPKSLEMKKIQVMKIHRSFSDLGSALEELKALTKSQQEISTAAFLALSNLLQHILEKVGPTMAVMRRDIQRNVERLEELYVSDPLIYSSLLEVLKKEMDEGTSRKADSCSRAVLWLTRSLDLSLALLEQLERDSKSSLREMVEEAYDKTLKPWHGWISTAAYKVALKLIPDKEEFIRLLMGKDQDHGMLKEDIRMLIFLLQPLIDKTYSHLRSFKLERLKST